MSRNTGFKKVQGGYERRISDSATEFIPDMCVESFIPETGTVEMYKPEYPELKETGEAKIGINSYRYETQKPQTGADLELQLSHSGKYMVKPLRSDLTLKGRGIRKMHEDGAWYYVTDLALEKLKTQYKILQEMMFD